MNQTSAHHQEAPSDFGIRLMEGEEVIFSLRPYRFVWYHVVSAAVTIIGIPLIPIVWLGAVIAQRYHYWLTNQQVVWCHGFIGCRVRMSRGASVGSGIKSVPSRRARGGPPESPDPTPGRKQQRLPESGPSP